MKEKDIYILPDITNTKETKPFRGPYVVSGDIQTLLTDWAEQKDFCLPSDDFFGEFRQDFIDQLSLMFPVVEYVQEDELTQGIKKIVETTKLPAITLDRVYFKTPPRLDLTRAVNQTGNVVGLKERSGTPLLVEQIAILKSLGISKATLVDDVVFEGGTAEKIACILEGAGISIPIICAGVAVEEGKKNLKELGRSVIAVRSYDSVEDEVCERDFFPGVPYSGRSIEGFDANIPYILPFGKFGEWASIRENWVKPFSRFCLGQTQKLFSEIEQVSGRQVTTTDIGPGILGLPQNNTRFVSVIEKVAELI